ncbi:MAG: MarR family transcriptional regulator [Phycisphaerales bacterium]|nr:MarR family transcriptional regulator [Phycisphaerales bacterium]
MEVYFSSERVCLSRLFHLIIDAMAEEVLALSQLSAVARTRKSAATAELTEPEFMALDAVLREGTMTVGDIQRRVGVLPAQMSRILRILEKHPSGKPLVESRINPDDRRRVDVTITAAGRSVHANYRRGRISFICDFLANLQEAERVTFMKIVRDFQGRVESLIGGKK